MKGISPLIASVLLIAFTVAIASLIMGWMGPYTRATTSNITSQSEVAVGCGSASIVIDHVYLTGSAGSVVAKNSGYKNFATVYAMVLNTTGANCTSASATLNVGEIKTLSVGACAIPSASFSRAIVTTECGGVGDTTSKTSDLN